MHKRKKQGKTAKKLLIIFLIVAAAAGAAFGIYALIRSVSGKEVNVYSVDDLYMDYAWGSQAETDGTVSTDKIQSVYVSSTQQITEIYVEEGQTVKAGDPILAFDTTLSELELDRQSIKVEQLELDLQNAKDELEEIGTYRVGSASSYTSYTSNTGTSGSTLTSVAVPYDRAAESLGTASDPLIYLWDDSCTFSESFIRQLVALAMERRAAAAAAEEDPAETEEPVETEEPAETEDPTETDDPAETEEPVETEEPAETDDPTETEDPTETDEPVETEEPTETDAPGETGEPEETDEPAETDDPAETEEPAETSDPSGTEETDEADDPHVYVVFEVRESNALGGTILRSWEMVLLIGDDGSWTVNMIEPVYDPGDDSGSGDDSDSSYYYDSTVYYTASEIAQLKAECNQKIKDLTLELKMAKLEYERLQYELSNGEVYSKIDGVIKTVRDPDEALQEDLPVVLVSGGGGYYVTAALSEMELASMHVGDTVTVQSWESYAELEGVITEISEYPDESGQYWHYSEGNQNVSLYPFKVFVDEDANLREGEYVTICYEPGGTESTGMYLQVAFIRQENGKSYVYAVGEDGLLEKRYIKTGQNLWGWYLEILDGLTLEDYIAFPYGSATVDGAKIRYADTDELYSYY